MLVSMGEREVGAGMPIFIVFEAGPTHTGLESAKALAQQAKSAGADAIKFQITDHSKLIRDRSLMFSYSVVDDQGRTEEVTEPLFDIWQRRFMHREDWRLLKQYCDEIGLCFFATVFSKEDVDFLVELGVTSLKIASQDMNYAELIEYAAETKLPVQIDTGSSSIGEVERAVDWIRRRGNENIIINHCPSGYPARLESIHLRMIPTLRSMFPYPLAFSDHNPGWDIDIAAVAVGTNIVEKTITLDRTQRSCEHMFSLEKHEMSQFVDAIRSIEVALGDKRRILGSDQLAQRTNVRRSAFLVRDVLAGETVVRDDFEFMRPGFGVGPDEFERFLGLNYRRDMKAGSPLTPLDL